MSGIFGIFRLDGRPVESSELSKIAGILAHRGPDGAEVWSQGSVGLGHRMLWTTPESLHEKLPLTGQAGQLVLTADARIDNRAELIPALGLSHRPADEITDSDLILAAYQKWGQNCPEKLMGDFAFAIWDEPRQQLFCARDPLGVKPFYYYHDHNIFVFASEIKGLLCLPDVPRKLNETRLADYLAHIFDDQSTTFYADVWRLPAAHALTVTRQKITRSQYWLLQTPRELRLSSDDDYVEAFREAFFEAVKCRLRSAFAGGSTLSGGLDSSSIACVARNIRQQAGCGPLHTFSAIFPGLPGTGPRTIDERPYIEAVVNMGGVTPHYVRADLLSPLTEIDRVLWHLDEPVFAPNLYIHWALYQAAQAAGVRVFLDGENGDTTVSHGYEYMAQLACTGRLVKLYQETSALAQKYNVKTSKAIWSLGVKPLVPERMLDFGRALLRRPATATLERSIINPDFARRMETLERMRAFEVQKEQVSPCNAREVHRAAIPSPLLFYSLELANRAASAFGVEPRYPFLDRRFIDICLALPPGQKLHQGWDRVIMRRAMTGLLPPEVQWRPFKANLGLNFRRNLLEFEGKTVAALFEKQAMTIQPYVDLPRVDETYRHYFAGHNVTEQTSEVVYMAGMLALWLQNENMV